MTTIDYDSIAEIYDAYVSADYDFQFFARELSEVTGHVLELTSGTGRLSIPLVEAGAKLTCVDYSAEMLSVLSQKLTDRGLEADVSCQDVCELAVDRAYDLAIFPFQSFMEIVGEDRQRDALRAVFSALKPGGRCVCTLHNPVIRRATVDGVLRAIGDFPLHEGRLVVTGIERGGDPLVSRLQFFEFFSAEGVLEWKRLLPMQFELIEAEPFRRMAEDAGFVVEEVLGNYDGSSFDAETSSVMIWRLHRPV